MDLKKNVRICDPNFFLVNALKLSRRLLGNILVRKIGNKISRFKIVEVEAYLGKVDKACHSHNKNKWRSKAIALYSRGGFTYVYLIYGIYYCFNVVASLEGDPQGVLIRALEPLDNSYAKENSTKISCCPTNGPGKLCNFLKIDKSINNIDMTTSEFIWLEFNQGVWNSQVVASKRVNIKNAEEYKDKLWRFYLKESKFVSKKDKQKELNC